MPSDEELLSAERSTDQNETRLGSMLQRIGSGALIGGIGLSMLQSIIDVPIAGATLGYVMIGGIVVAAIGAGLNKLNTPGGK